MSDRQRQQVDPGFGDDSAAFTYFYLRVAVMLLVVLLTVAVLRQDLTRPDGEPLASISASWYTPVQSVFVAVLTGAGAAMVALRGRGIQEPLLNFAGVFAPVVAFVPTPGPVQGPCFGRPAGVTPEGRIPVAVGDGRWDAAVCAEFVARIDGAMVPYFWVGSVALALVLLYVVVRRRNPALVYRDADAHLLRWCRDRLLRGDVREPTRTEDVAGVGLTALVWAAGIAWWTADRTSFMLTAHAVAAAFVFLPLGAVALLAGLAARRGRTAATQTFSSRGRRVTAVLYVVVALAMLTGVVAAAGARLFHWAGASGRELWWLEWTILLGFLGFWMIQTFEARIPRATRRVPAQTVV